MERYRGEFSRMLFDHSYPTISWAREHYKDVVDLSNREGLTGTDIGDAIANLKENRQMLVLPEGVYYGGAPYRHKKRGLTIPLYNSARFRKFGPEINMTKRDITISEIKEKELSPRKLFKETLNSPEVREKLKTGIYRGLGYWSPRSGRHNIIWFDVPAEGQAFLNMFRREFRTEYQFADALQHIPSYSQIKGVRAIDLSVLPVTEFDGEFYVEALETFAPKDCKDSFFMRSAGKKKIADEFEGLYKYRNPEQAICKHGWSQRLYAECQGDMPGGKPLLVKQPRATGFMSYWKKSKTQAFIKHGSSLRRPLKSEVGDFCQAGYGTLTPEEAFDLSE